MLPCSSDYIITKNNVILGLGTRGQIIVGTHCLVVEPSGGTKPTSGLASDCPVDNRVSQKFTQFIERINFYAQE
jgi:hypothetical protein